MTWEVWRRLEGRQVAEVVTPELLTGETPEDCAHRLYEHERNEMARGNNVAEVWLDHDEMPMARSERAMVKNHRP